MKKQRPILFSTRMINAVLSGKTITRRIIKDTAKQINVTEPAFAPEWEYVRCYDGTAKFWELHHATNEHYVKCPYGKPGDVLWVRESYTTLEPEHCEGMSKRFYYKASHDESNEGWRLECIKDGYPYRWKPSIHMPKQAARIFLEIVSVRAEKLHDISEEDILAEGVRIPATKEGNILFQMGGEHSAWNFMPEQWKVDQYVKNRGKEKYVHKDYDFLFAHFAELWCEINGFESWRSNPWVWVVEFKVLSTTGEPSNL